MYADDILLLSPSVTALQDLLHVCESTLSSLDLFINPWIFEDRVIDVTYGFFTWIVYMFHSLLSMSTETETETETSQKRRQNVSPNELKLKIKFR